MIPAAWAFGWSLFLQLDLTSNELHPDDYDSAQQWRAFWNPVFLFFPPLLGVAYTCIFFAFIGIMSLKVKPSLSKVTVLQAVAGFASLFVFYGAFPVFFIIRSRIRNRLDEQRGTFAAHDAKRTDAEQARADAEELPAHAVPLTAEE
jgi:hypothetical protein